ncbi:MAG: TraB/GumN family protein [Myxococcota bacterium]
MSPPRAGWRFPFFFALIFGLVATACRTSASSSSSPSPSPSLAPSLGRPASPVASAPASSSAATPSPPAERPAATSPSPPLLYEVVTEGSRAHLFGTMHMGGDPDRDLHPVVWTRFAASPQVVLEADLAGIDPAQMMARAQLPPGASLSSMLRPDQFAALRGALVSLPPGFAIDRLRPHVAMSLLVREMVPKTRPMDLVLQSRAARAGKALAYLETVEAQMELLESAIDAEALGYSLDHLDEMRRRLGVMTEAYLRGDVAALEAAVFDPDEMAAQPEMFARIFKDRNEQWMKRLPELMKGDAFVAVGAGHLLGSDGLVARLRARGHRVSRVVPAAAAAQ